MSDTQRTPTIEPTSISTRINTGGLDGHAPPPVFGDVLENSTRRAETVK
jgi:hypothetical protein